MANVIITLRIMPSSPDINLKEIEEKSLSLIKEFAGETETKTQTKPVAFGLNSLEIIFVMDENKGNTDELENEIKQIQGVNSVELIDVRRAIG